MGNPKLKWTAEEEEALRAGVAKHGAGKWKNIQRDPEFNHLLYARSNIDLKKQETPRHRPLPTGNAIAFLLQEAARDAVPRVGGTINVAVDKRAEWFLKLHDVEGRVARREDEKWSGRSTL